VYFHKVTGKWSLDIAGKHRGLFLTKEAAALKYNEIATVLFGEFASLNPVL
jgi:hypothetical protein